MADELPRVHIGLVDEKPVDLGDPATANDGEPDSDAQDEQKQTPPWMKAALGFDPAEKALMADGALDAGMTDLRTWDEP